jgi:bifunctional non-homologous end joining protein LigD
VGSLLFGVPDDQGRLIYAGHVGTGFTEQTLREIERLLSAGEVSAP